MDPAQINPYNLGFEIRGTAFLLSLISASSLCYLEYVSHSALDGAETGADPASAKRFMDAYSLRQVVLLVISWLGLVWSGIMTTIAGKVMYPKAFRVWQPFEGGRSFVLQQAFGWCLFILSFILTTTLLMDFERTKPLSYGVYVSLAFLTVASQCMLNLSLDDFDPDSTSQSGTSTRFSRLLLRVDCATIVGVHMMCYMFFVLADLRILDETTVKQWFDALSLVSIVAVLVSQYVVGFRGYGKKLYEPFQGGVNFILLQALGWSFYGIYCYLAVFVVSVDDSLPRGVLTVYGILSLSSHLILLSSLQHYSSQAKVKHVEAPTQRKSWILKLVQLAALTSSGYFGLILLQNRLGTKQGVRAHAIFEVLVSFVLMCPLLHFSGYCCLSGYRVWQPLEGGVSFVCLQGFGWFLYGCLLLNLGRSNSVYDDVRAFETIGPLGVSSQLCLLVSLSQFRHDKVREESRLRRASTSSGTIVQESWKYFCARVVSFFMAVLAFGIGVCLDVSYGILPRQTSIVASIICSCLAVVSLQYSALLAVPQLSVFKPFQGTPRFIVGQAIAWTTFAVALLGQIILVIGSDDNFSSRTKETLGFGWFIIIASTHAFAYISMHYGVSQQLAAGDVPLVEEVTTEIDPEVVKDLEELEKLISLAERASVRAALLKAKESLVLDRAQGSSIHVGKKALLLGSLCVLLAHLSIVLFVYVDMTRGAHSMSLFLVATASAVLAAVLSQAFLGPVLHNHGTLAEGTDAENWAGYKPFQPFGGGFRFVVLQFAAWCLFAVGMAAALVVANFGVSSISSVGFITGVGSLLYAAQVVLLWSLGQFSASSSAEKVFGSKASFGSTSLLLGATVMLMCIGVDTAILRFGLPFEDAYLVQTCAGVALSMSLPFAIWLRRKHLVSPGRGSVVLLVAGCALWSFTVLLGLLLVKNFAIESHKRLWLSSTAGVANMASHAFVALSSTTNKRAIFLFPVASVLMWVAITFFSWIVLPALRGFLDWPMYLYAKTAKRWAGWVSPDGVQALEGIHLKRSISYCDVNNPLIRRKDKQLLDIMTPLKKNPAVRNLGKFPPLLYFHGGGHICVHREILHHSVTPFVRTGMTVYSAEYPLSPEAKYPHAVLSRWVMLNTCPNQCNDAMDTSCSRHECTSDCRHYLENDDKTCAFCGSKLGCESIQLIGDSAGGSLASMVTALMCNQDLREETIKLVNSNGEYDDLVDAKFPIVERLVCIYGLLGRQTYVEEEKEAEDTKASFLFKVAQYVGVKFIFRLYDHPEKAHSKVVPTSTITDLKKNDLKCFAKETLLLCGKDDPLLLSNIKAFSHLKDLGFKVRLEGEYPATHGFHGFPVLWMKYLQSDWTRNSLPATHAMLEFLSGNRWQLDKHGLQVDKMDIIPDRSPLVVFPLVFGLPFAFAVWNFW